MADQRADGAGLLTRLRKIADEADLHDANAHGVEHRACGTIARADQHQIGREIDDGFRIPVETLESAPASVITDRAALTA